MECSTKTIEITSICVSARIRKDIGGIDELIVDIKTHGLINPITVMDNGNNKYILIAGLRRLEAFKKLNYTSIRATILSPLAADELLTIEYAENVQRKNFTVAERLDYAEKIKAVEKAKARERMSQFSHSERADVKNKSDTKDKLLGTDERPYPSKGESRKNIAQKAGFTSYKQYERAEKVATERPDLLEKIDNGEATIYGAYMETAKQKEKTDEIKHNESPKQQKTVSSDQIVRAGHSRLMKNPLYIQLQADLQEAKYEANRARTELDRKTEFFNNQVKHFESNIYALKLQRDELITEIDTLKTRLKQYEVCQ